MARDYFHSSTVQAAECAKEAGAKRLILTHISSRFTEDDAVELQAEARAVFPETEIAHDLALIKI